MSLGIPQNPFMCPLASLNIPTCAFSITCYALFSYHSVHKFLVILCSLSKSVRSKAIVQDHKMYPLDLQNVLDTYVEHSFEAHTKSLALSTSTLRGQVHLTDAAKKSNCHPTNQLQSPLVPLYPATSLSQCIM